MRVLGIDYGRRRVGLALSDPQRRIASPLATYVRRDESADAKFFATLVAQNDVAGAVVGLPVHLSGDAGPLALEALRFGEWLQRVTGLEVAFLDERYTSVEADRHLRDAGLNWRQRRQRRDKLAAQILLQTYLDRGCKGDERPEALTDAVPAHRSPDD